MIFAGATISVYDEESGLFSDYNIPADGVSACGQIPSTDLSLTWGISRYPSSGNVLVTYSYEWINTPINRYQDPIGISWDDTRFEMIDNTFYKVDKYQGYIVNSDNTSGPIETITHSEEHNYASGSSSGVTWYADLAGYLNTHVVTSLFGHGEFLLSPKSSNFTTTFYGHYVHAKTAFNLSLSIPGYGLGFSVSGSSPYDEIGNQRTYTY